MGSEGVVGTGVRALSGFRVLAGTPVGAERALGTDDLPLRDGSLVEVEGTSVLAEASASSDRLLLSLYR